MSLTLSISDELLSVCRFPTGTHLPAWLFTSNGFYSITRTEDELSIVCRQDILPDSVREAPSKVERDWKALKVKGPLDFSLTGILASLAKPLADAEISIFAISTYDTDFILIQGAAKMEKAIKVLQKEGHTIIRANKSMTVDGPSTIFQPDPMVIPLVEKQQKHTDTFGLVVVAGWPWVEIQSNYNSFKESLSLCFLKEDLVGHGDHNPAVYLYPASAMHITVATYRAIQQTRLSPESEQMLSDCCKMITSIASKMPSWPKNKLQLSIQNAQIGTRAGILLWKETTGGLEAMRKCIQATVKEYQQRQSCRLSESERAVLNQALEEVSIPPIIHSTFLRFYANPLTDGATIQENFQTLILPRLADFFPEKIGAATVKLVCETTPYMHIPYDENHVLFECNFP